MPFTFRFFGLDEKRHLRNERNFIQNILPASINKPIAKNKSNQTKLKILAIFIKITTGNPVKAHGVTFHTLLEYSHRLSASPLLGKECIAIEIFRM